MLKMLAHPPYSTTGAFRIATSARNSLWRKERRHRGHADIAGREIPNNTELTIPEGEGVYESLRRVLPHEVEWLLNYYREDRPKVAGWEAKRASDYRKRVRAVWELLRPEWYNS